MSGQNWRILRQPSGIVQLSRRTFSGPSVSDEVFLRVCVCERERERERKSATDSALDKEMTGTNQM